MFTVKFDVSSATAPTALVAGDVNEISTPDSIEIHKNGELFRTSNGDIHVLYERHLKTGGEM